MVVVCACGMVLHRRLFQPLWQLAVAAGEWDGPGHEVRTGRSGGAEIERIRAGLNRLADDNGRLRGLMELLAGHPSVGMAPS